MIKISKKIENKSIYLRLRRRVGGKWNYDSKVKVPKLNASQVAELQSFANALASSLVTGTELSEKDKQKIEQLEENPNVLDLFKRAGLIKAKPKKHYSVRKILKGMVEDDQKAADNGYLVQSTVERRNRVVNHLLDYLAERKLGVDFDIRKIDFAVAEGFRDYRLLDQKRSEHFIRAEIKWIRGYFKRALERGIIRINPFVGVKVPIKLDQDNRRVFLPTEILDPIDDWLKENKEYSWWPYWCLVRYTGCRRAEALQLKWSDIDWSNETINMPSPKTRRSGKSHRLMPIYVGTPLLEMLEDLYEYQREPKSGYVVRDILGLKDNKRDDVKWDRKNPTTTLEWFVIQSGIAPWPKLLQNLRVTRENELLQSGDYRAEAIHSFIGHTAKAFSANYKKINRDDFKPRSKQKTSVELLVNEFGLLYVPSYVPRIAQKYALRLQNKTLPQQVKPQMAADDGQ